jgi:hypothetical protein
MLAHINPEEAALLKSRGGSGTINPNTGLPEFKFGGFIGQALSNPGAALSKVDDTFIQPTISTVKDVVAPASSFTSRLVSRKNPFNSVISSVVAPVEKAAGQVTSNLANLPGSVENTVKQVAANPVAQLALTYYMPGISASLAPYMVGVPAAYQTAVASALASTAIQTAQGVPFEQALKSATVNAVTSTGAPVAAIYVEDLVGNQKVADVLTSIGASAAKTAASGGTKDDIEKNMVAALTGSGLTSALQTADVSRDVSRVAGSAAGGAVVGGTTGAISGAASELGSQAARDAAKLEAQKGTKLAAAGDGTMTDAGRMLDTVQVVNQREPDPTLQDTSIITPNVSVSPKAKSPAPTARTPLSLVTVTGTREPDPTLQDTDITLPETTVTGTQETEPTDTSAKEAKPPVDAQGRYDPSLFIYGGKSRPASTLGSSLKTQAPFYPLAGTSGGLTSTRGAGELESKETGKPRQNVWNEESLRLKDALGV